MTDVRYDNRLKQIEDAALAVFVERGFENTTLEAVAEKLGYTKQAIYYYFRSKEELVLSFCLHILRETRDEVVYMCSQPGSPETKLGRLITYHVKGSCERQGFFALHHNLKQILARTNDEEKKAEMFTMMREIPDLILAIIREGVDTGIFRAEKPEVLSGIVYSLLGGIMSIDDLPSLRPLETVIKAELICDIILKGIRK